MDHLHWYWVRARRARLRAVVLGIFEEAHAVCYYLTSGDDGRISFGGALSYDLRVGSGCIEG